MRTLTVALVLATTLLTGFARADEVADKLTTDSNQVLQDYFKHPEWEGVRTVLGAAKAALIVPVFTSGAMIVGYDSGNGVLIARHDEQWSDPVFVKLQGATVGLQAGVKESKLLMIVLTRQAVSDLVNGVSRVGGSGGFALGGVGLGASGGGGLSGGVQMLSVSLSEGLALGGALSGLKMSPLEDANRSVYGAGFDMKAVLDGAGGGYAAAAALRSTLAETVQRSRKD